MTFTTPEKLADSAYATNGTATITFGGNLNGIIELKSLYVSVTGGTGYVLVSIMGLNTTLAQDTTNGTGQLDFPVPPNQVLELHDFFSQEILANNTLTISATSASGQTVGLLATALLT